MSRFEPVGGMSVKVVCVVCGQRGHGPVDPTPETAAPWQLKCMAGHPYGCVCGRRFTGKVGAANHVGNFKTLGGHHLVVEDEDPDG